MDEIAHDSEDRRLVERVLHSRSEQAFRQLYRRHAAALHRASLRLAGGDASEAEEIVQETWIRAMPRLARFAWRSTLRTWLIGFAVNVNRERARRRVDEEPERTLRLIDGGRDSAARIDLERAIARLPPGYREVIVLFDVEGYSHQEIGEMLGIGEGTSKSQLSRARKAVRALLTVEGEASRG